MLPGKKIYSSFVFHADFIESLPKELTAEWTAYCINYGLCRVEPIFTDPLHAELWNKLKSRMDADKDGYEVKLQNQKIWNAKNHLKQGRATKKEIEFLSKLGLMEELSEEAKNGNCQNSQKLPPYSPHESDSEFDSVSEFESDSEYVYESESDTEVNVNKKYFLDLWNEHTDVFGVAMNIERPLDFAKFFTMPKITKEYIKTGVDNYVQAIKSGKLNRCFIPSTPDRFILKNTLERFQKPYNATGNKSASYDADHRGEFAEATRL